MSSHRKSLFTLMGIVLLSALAQAALGHGMSEEEKQAVIQGGNMRYMWLGATHMLSGYDHLAFVFGIIFFLTTFRDIAKYVTAFTVGHSVTLIYATFNAIQLNYFLIDAVIGLSVSYIAFANIDGFRKYLSVNPPNMLAMIVGLGLIHGFGLSTRLQELPLSEDDLLMNIISFNVGIELGQVSALAVMLVVIAGFRRHRGFQAFSLIANYTLIFAGAFLFLMQMHGYEHTTNEELGSANAAMAPAASSQPVAAQTQGAGEVAAVQWLDTIEVIIPARSDTEYKLGVAKDRKLEYSWSTDGEKLYFDFHGDPEGDTSGYFESYGKGTLSESSGTLTPSFTGRHGWYWKNTSREAVTVTLKVAGDYRRLDLGEDEGHHDSLD